MSPPRKHPDGLSEVLFVRIDAELLAEVDNLVLARRASRPGTSRSDVVREILRAEVERMRALERR